jgi:hypothetical protein
VRGRTKGDIEILEVENVMVVVLLERGPGEEEEGGGQETRRKEREREREGRNEARQDKQMKFIAVGTFFVFLRARESSKEKKK